MWKNSRRILTFFVCRQVVKGKAAKAPGSPKKQKKDTTKKTVEEKLADDEVFML